MATDIAIYLPSLEGGGAERAMVTLANGMAEKGYSVDLVLASATGPYLTELSRKVNLVDLKSKRVIFSLPNLISYLRRERPRAVLSALHHANVVAVLAHSISRVKSRLVVSERTSISMSKKNGYSFKFKIVYKLLAWAYRKADAIVAVSDGVASDLCDSLNIKRDEIEVIYNPVVTKDLLQKSKEAVEHPWLKKGEAPVILAVGRLTPAKDYKTLIKAFAQVRAEIDARLVILGEGELRSALTIQVRELGLEHSVDLPGFVKNPFAWMSKVQLFVMSSAWEGLPNALIQAMACGARVISTDCRSGPAEVLEGGLRGELVEVGNYDALSVAIVNALKKLDCACAKGTDLRFDAETVVHQYLKVLTR